MNDLEDLFSKQPPFTDDELAKVISHMRELRAAHESGTKLKKHEGPKAKSIDLSALGLSAPKPTIGKIKL